MQIQANGIVANYELSGPEGAPVVVLSHSLGSNLSMWDFQLSALEPHYRVFRYDTRGHGGSQTTSGESMPGAYTLDELGDDALALLDALGLEQVHWVGLSMGGMIGQNVVLRQPERFLSLSLCDTMAQLPSAAQSIWQERISTARNKGMEALVEPTMERWFTALYRDEDPAGLKLIRQYFLNTSIDGYIGCSEAIRQLDYLDRLQEISIPTLIVVGEQDSGTPVSASQAMHERIKGSHLEIIPNAAHLSNVEQSEEFNRILSNFLHNVA